MDNLTHSLFGAAVAEVASQKCPNPKLRVPIYFTAIASSNFPDIDFVTRFFGGRLNYLLQHRGYTHTLVGIVPQLIIMLALTYFLFKKKHSFCWRDWKWLGFVTAVAFALHIFLDSLNTYGVHPFWPFNNNWYYGDSIFILEPLFWIVLALGLAFSCTSRIARYLNYGVTALALAICTYANMVPIMLKVFYFVSFAACVALFYSSKWRHHCVVALGICFLFIFAMNQASRSLRADLMSSLFKENPNINLKDIFLSSSPGNLLCWRTTIAEARQEHIVYHSGRIAIWPKIKTLAQCEVSTSEPPSPANYTFLPNERWRFKQSIYYPKAEFAELQRKNCYFENFLYFARLPAWQIQNERLQFGDLRFQRKRPASGFTNFDYPLQSQNCPFSAVPWRPPSHDWL